VKEGYARKLVHQWHGPFRVAEMINNYAARLEIAGSEYRIFPVVHVSKLKLVRMFPDRPEAPITVDEADRVDFDEALFPEDSWQGPLGEDDFEVGRVAHFRTGRRTRYGRIHRDLLVH
jgi:hypothetical protein